jgi:hypothetical protein
MSSARQATPAMEPAAIAGAREVDGSRQESGNKSGNGCRIPIAPKPTDPRPTPCGLGQAQARSGPMCALTFTPHPERVLQPALAPPLLCSRAPKAELLAARRVRGAAEGAGGRGAGGCAGEAAGGPLGPALGGAANLGLNPMFAPAA